MGSIAWRGLRWFTDVRTPSGDEKHRHHTHVVSRGAELTLCRDRHIFPKHKATRTTVKGHVPWLSASPRSRGHRPRHTCEKRDGPCVCTTAGTRMDRAGGGLSTARGSRRDRAEAGPPRLRGNGGLTARAAQGTGSRQTRELQAPPTPPPTESSTFKETTPHGPTEQSSSDLAYPPTKCPGVEKNRQTPHKATVGTREKMQVKVFQPMKILPPKSKRETEDQNPNYITSFQKYIWKCI